MPTAITGPPNLPHWHIPSAQPAVGLVLVPHSGGSPGSSWGLRSKLPDRIRQQGPHRPLWQALHIWQGPPNSERPGEYKLVLRYTPITGNRASADGGQTGVCSPREDAPQGSICSPPCSEPNSPGSAAPSSSGTILGHEVPANERGRTSSCWGGGGGRSNNKRSGHRGQLRANVGRSCLRDVERGLGLQH